MDLLNIIKGKSEEEKIVDLNKKIDKLFEELKRKLDKKYQW